MGQLLHTRRKRFQRRRHHPGRASFCTCRQRCTCTCHRSVRRRARGRKTAPARLNRRPLLWSSCRGRRAGLMLNDRADLRVGGQERRGDHHRLKNSRQQWGMEAGMSAAPAAPRRRTAAAPAHTDRSILEAEQSFVTEGSCGLDAFYISESSCWMNVFTNPYNWDLKRLDLKVLLATRICSDMTEICFWLFCQGALISICIRIYCIILLV